MSRDKPYEQLQLQFLKLFVSVSLYTQEKNHKKSLFLPYEKDYNNTHNYSIF